MMDGERVEIRCRLRKILNCRPRGRRYPEALRQAVRSYVRRSLAAGMDREKVCRGLGIRPALLDRLVQEASSKSPIRKEVEGFRAVSLRDDLPHDTCAGPDSRCTLTTPAGIRVEGLGVAQVAYLLRVLG